MLKRALLLGAIIFSISACKTVSNADATENTESQETTTESVPGDVSKNECPPCVTPLSEIHKDGEVPDKEFIAFAEEFVNLIATYQPRTAERQFSTAAEMLMQPFLTFFEKEFLQRDLKVITEVQRSQVMHIDSALTTLGRDGTEINVTIVGNGVRYVKDKNSGRFSSEYRVTMKTTPRTRLNPYGIAIVDLNISTRRGE